MDETRTLAQFVSKTGYSDLPASVIERMKVYTLDVLAAGMVGSKLPWANMVLEMAREQRGVEEASVFATSEKMTVSQAALVNGVMVGGFESEHVGHTSHPAGTVTPAALAIGERDRVSGQEFLLATALGYEVVCRIGDAQTGLVETERGFHNPAANGPFSAAAAVGKLLGFDAATQASAFGIAGSHCGGLTEYAWDGSMTKRLHLGRASQLGLESALLAQKGFTGPHTILEGRYGYFNAFSPAPKIEKLLAGLGEQWQLETLIIKRYPCHVSSQAVVAAVQEFKREQGFDPDQIESIALTGSKRILQQRFLDPNPTNEMGAQYSLLFTTAVACYRDLDDPLQYDESVLEDAQIKRLANAITWQEAEESAHESLAATLEFTIAGRTHAVQAETFPGSLQTPASLADVESKFRRFSKHVLSDAQQQDVLELVGNLEQLDDVSKLADAMRS